MIYDLSKPGLIARKIEDEGLVEDRVQRSLLHVRLLLRDPLLVVHQVDLHIRICNGKYLSKKKTICDRTRQSKQGGFCIFHTETCEPCPLYDTFYGKNTLYGIGNTEVSECKLIYQKY